MSTHSKKDSRDNHQPDVKMVDSSSQDDFKKLQVENQRLTGLIDDQNRKHARILREAQFSYQTLENENKKLQQDLSLSNYNYQQVNHRMQQDLLNIKKELADAKNERDKFKYELDEIKRRKQLTVTVPVVFDVITNNYDVIVQALDSIGHSNYLKFEVVNHKQDLVVFRKRQGASTLPLYFVNLSTPRLQQQYSEERFAEVQNVFGKGKTLFNCLRVTDIESRLEPLLCVIRYGSNASTFPTFFDDPLASGQFLYDGAHMLQCDQNTQNVDKIFKLIRQANPHM